MFEIPLESIVEKLILLERASGSNLKHQLAEPFGESFCDFNRIQRRAKIIAETVGLSGYRFHIALATQRRYTGGHIDLSTNGHDVFIEIDPALQQFPDVLSATLCHEICHKWLQQKGISLQPEIENEILTDITCVFLGFGKIMLNGCNSSKSRREFSNGETQMITETMKAGYLNLGQFALVFNLVCTMRQISERERTAGLNNAALNAVSTGAQYVRELQSQNQLRKMHGELKSNISDAQHVLIDLDKCTKYVLASFCNRTSSFHSKSSKELIELSQNEDLFIGEGIADSPETFLTLIQRDCIIRRQNEMVKATITETRALLASAKVIGGHIYANRSLFSAPLPGMFNILVCPVDGTKLRLPENSGKIIVTCPKCKNSFPYDTSPVSFFTTRSPTDGGYPSRIRLLWKTLPKKISQSLFKRKIRG